MRASEIKKPGTYRAVYKSDIEEKNIDKEIEIQRVDGVLGVVSVPIRSLIPLHELRADMDFIFIH